MHVYKLACSLVEMVDEGSLLAKSQIKEYKKVLSLHHVSDNNNVLKELDTSEMEK